MSRFNLLCMFTFCTCFAARDPPTLTIPDQGIVMGKEVSRSRVQKIIAYYGIPYAQQPLGKLRFAPPVTDPMPFWEGVRNITDYLPACLQTNDDYREEDIPFLELIYPSYRNLTTDEDCLYLNVFVPSGGPPSPDFATIVWIHPGNFATGSPSMWNPHTLVYRHRIILVTMAWRLGIMGFFSTIDGESPGNYGLMDQQAAMMWVKKNIKIFGGNPNNICLMGYGTGGVSVGIHMINENSRDYFNKAIVMSANLFSPSVLKTKREYKRLLHKIASTFGCNVNSTAEILQCLRRPEGKTLLEVASDVNWRPLVDYGLSNNTQPFLSETPKSSFENGNFHKIPFLTGYTNMEEILAVKNLDAEFTSNNVSRESLQQFLTEIISSDFPMSNNNSESKCAYNYDHITDAVMFFYGPSSNVRGAESLRKILADFTTERNYAASTFLQANYISREQPTFTYRFDMKPVTRWAVENIPEWVAVPHLYDLIYVWGIPYWQEYDYVNTWEIRDKRFSDIIMSFWTNFAKYSDPNEGSLYAIRWESFSNESPRLLIMDGFFNMSSSTNLNYKAFEFWNEYYPKVVQISTQCCNATDDDTISVHASYILLLVIEVLINCIHLI